MKEKARYLYITEHDAEQLEHLIKIGSTLDAAHLESLEKELSYANVVSPKKILPDVVTMNSTVRVKDMDSGEEKTYTIVFPNRAGMVQNAISVLAPLGTALLGYKEGDLIEWEVPGGTRRYKVLKIIYQSERDGKDGA
jgi:regulator of nucleoside diphosphate kinase